MEKERELGVGWWGGGIGWGVGGGGWGHAVGLIIYISVPAAITVMFMAHTVL